MAKEQQEKQSRPRVQIDLSKGGRTVESYADELDVGRIVSRYLLTGERPAVNQPQWGSSMPSMDFQEMQEKIAHAKQWFAALPAKTRGMFENDPAKALEYLEHAKNKESALEMGLAHNNPPDMTDPDTEAENTESATAETNE